MQVNRTVFSVGNVSDPSDEKAYWLSQAPAERLRSLENMRRIVYGYTSTSPGLQRFLEIAELPCAVHRSGQLAKELGRERAVEGPRGY